MADPLASILIVAATPPRYLHTAISSALAQSVHPLEVIVAVNPSALLPHVEQQLNAAAAHIRCVRASADVGRGELLHMGVSAARGEYITWLDADEVFHPRKVETQVAALAATNRLGCATCGIRIHNDGNLADSLSPHRGEHLTGLARNRTAVLASLLDGSRAASTLLAHRSCLAAAGGFSEAERILPELELGVRLAQRSQFVHVPARLMRTHSNSDRAAAVGTLDWQNDLDRIRHNVLAGAASSLSSFAVLARSTGVDLRRSLPLLTDKLAAAVDGRHLTVGITSEISPDSNERISMGSCMYVDDADPLKALRELVCRSASDWVLLLDTPRTPASDTILQQLVEVIAGELDACLAREDRLVHEFDYSESLIPRTLFRRSALQKLDWTSLRDEQSFWTAFLMHSQVGGLPPEHPVQRPGSSLPEAVLTPVELMSAVVDREWYLRTHADVAAAGILPVDHYFADGWREGRNPNSWFDTSAYLERYPESAQLPGGPLQHLFTQTAASSQFWQQPGFLARLNISRSLGSRPATPDDLIRILMPGLGEIAKARRWSAVESRGQLFAAVPRITELVRCLQTEELPSYELLARFVAREWYLAKYSDVAGAGIDPAEHYLYYGWRERRDPNPWFSTSWYLELNPAANQPDRPALEHFVLQGAALGQSPHPGFCLRWYTRRYLPGEPRNAEVLLHFLEAGAAEGLVPDPRLDTDDVHRLLRHLASEERLAKIRELQTALPDEGTTLGLLVDRNWYHDRYPDVRHSQIDPLLHYLLDGWREKRDPNPWFSTAFYLEQCPDAANGDICPLVHYVRTGAAEGFRPSPDFDPVWYAAHYLGGNSPSTSALVHLVTTGLSSGSVPEPALCRPELLNTLAATPVGERLSVMRRFRRSVKKESRILIDLIDCDWYRSTYAEQVGSGADSAHEYLEEGWRAGRDPNPWFCSEWYLNMNPDARAAHISPLEHFVRSGARNGRRPHPFFDIAWYATRYLSGAPSSAEAFHHFMTIGRHSGNSTDPRLATDSVQRRLQRMSLSDRTAVLKTCITLLSERGTSYRISDEDAEAWPVLLTRNVPEGALPVLILDTTTSADSDTRPIIRGAAMSLPPEESAIFGILESANNLRLSASLERDDVSVTLTLPEQFEQLRRLLTRLECRRAASVGTGLIDSPIVRLIRKAGLPVFTNASGD